MADNARVCWIEQSEPWDLESQLISRFDLPLNLDQNRHNSFHSRLKEVRAKHAGERESCPSARRPPNEPLPGPSDAVQQWPRTINDDHQVPHPPPSNQGIGSV